MKPYPIRFDEATVEAIDERLSGGMSRAQWIREVVNSALATDSVQEQLDELDRERKQLREDVEELQVRQDRLVGIERRLEAVEVELEKSILRRLFSRYRTSPGDTIEDQEGRVWKQVDR